MNTQLQPALLDGRFILAVDDDPVSLKLIEKLLQKEYTLFTATNALEALRILKVSIPALVILDVMMPEISGLDLCMILKTDERLRGVPVIFLSSCDKPADFQMGHDAGAVMYVTKPVRAAQLLKSVSLFASSIARKV